MNNARKTVSTKVDTDGIKVMAFGGEVESVSKIGEDGNQLKHVMGLNNLNLR